MSAGATSSGKDRARILSLDGGGIRGIIPAMLLAELERRAGRRTGEMFDLIAGTSTGGIIAIVLTRRDSSGQLRWTAQQLVDLYEFEGPTIFDRRGVLHGIVDVKYEAAALEAILARFCGESTLAQSDPEVLIPAYDVVKRDVHFFDSAAAKNDPARDLPARFVARATSAAPTYFEPPLGPRALASEDVVFVDGGLFANNPAMCAFTSAQRGNLGRDVLLASIGTGSQTRPLPFEEIRHWGAAQWARPILHVVLDGASIAIDQQLASVLGPERYWRFQLELTRARDELDDARPANIALLKQEAEGMISERSADIDRLVAAL
jgi:patatin-like phospholipase/acyl hydrolase